MAAYRFNIRVYGILINKQNEVFVTDEYRMGLTFTKFPGGGWSLAKELWIASGVNAGKKLGKK